MVVLSIIARSMRLIGAIATGETPTADEATDGLTALNGMLDSWRNESLMTWTVNDKSVAITAGQSAFTVGPGGSIDTARPVEIDTARIRWNGIDYPCDVIDQSQWASIARKTIKSNLPRYIYDSGDFPLRNMTPWPIPNQDIEIILGLKEPLERFSTVHDDVTMPPGYEEAMTYGLAIRLTSEFGLQPPAGIVMLYAACRRDLKRVNHQGVRLRSEPARGHRYTIFGDF